MEMASDGRTPKRIRDGQFVFIDEETCIGCVQVSRAVVYDPRLFDSRCPVVVYFVYGAFATERDESVTYRHRACVISFSFSLISKSLIPRPRFVRGIPQCAQIAPSSFKMIEDSGRARTYQQSSALDVENAVMVSRDIYIHIYPTFVLDPSLLSCLFSSLLAHHRKCTYIKKGLSRELHALHVFRRAEGDGGIPRRRGRQVRPPPFRRG